MGAGLTSVRAGHFQGMGRGFNYNFFNHNITEYLISELLNMFINNSLFIFTLNSVIVICSK